MNRRGFLAALVAAPVAAALPKGWLTAGETLAAPVTYGDISARTAALAMQAILHRSQSLLTLNSLGKVKPIVGSGAVDVVKFRRPAR